jgi:hypothetical protein
MKEAGLGDRQPRAEMDRVQGFLRGRGTRPYGRGDPAAHRGRGRPPARLVHGRTSMHTVRLAAEEGGFAYVADSYADDLPYWMRFGGRDQLIVPYTLDANDMRFATPQGFNSGYQFEAYLKDSSTRSTPRASRARRRCCRSGCIAASSGARAGRRRSSARSTTCAPMTGSGSPRAEIAEHWAKTHPPVPRRAHRRWTANLRRGLRRHLRAFALDRRARLRAGARPHPRHRAGRAFRADPRLPHRVGGGTPRRAERPSRPRREARRRQAADRGQHAEQASAGLDALTDAERAAFTGSTPPTPRNSAFPSSSPCATTTRRASSPPSAAASTMTARPNSPRPAARSSASRSCGSWTF